MKTFSRVIIILVVALLVSGAIYAFGQTSQAQSIVSGLSGRSGFEGRGARGRPSADMQLPQGQTETQSQTTTSQPPANFEGRGGGETGGFNIAGVGPVLKNAVIMGGIVVVIIAGTLALDAVRRRNRKSKAAPIAV